MHTPTETRCERADRAWDAFCARIYIAREPLRREEARARARACPCGHPDNRALCDVWACPFLSASVATDVTDDEDRAA